MGGLVSSDEYAPYSLSGFSCISIANIMPFSCCPLAPSHNDVFHIYELFRIHDSEQYTAGLRDGSIAELPVNPDALFFHP